MAIYGQKTLVLVLFLMLLTTTVSLCIPVFAADEAQWNPVNIPAEGSAGKWVLADGSDVSHLIMAHDGTFYCYANPSGTTYTLFKSTDAGRSWATVGKVTDAIIDIVTLPRDPDIVYYATTERIFKSTDAGKTFNVLPIPGNAGNGNVVITSIDAIRAGGADTIAVSTIDSDTGEYGGVYLLDEGLISADWINTGIGNYDVYRVAFSPDYIDDRQLIAIASDETATLAMSRIDVGNWGQAIGNAQIPGIVPTAACIAFPEGYNSLSGNAIYFIGIDTGIDNGDVYKITPALAPSPSIATKLNIGASSNIPGVDITTLAVSINTIFAGCAGSALIYLSTDAGATWTRCNKPPSGQTNTDVLIPLDFKNTHEVYAATCGTESGFSYSNDSGYTWNQISLIDTTINDITDFSTPSVSTLFVLTFNSIDMKHSLWRTLDSGKKWDRVFCSSFSGIDNLKFVKTPPQYGPNSLYLIVAGQKDGKPAIWQSGDNGQTFMSHIAPSDIFSWAIVDNTRWFIGCHDGSKALVLYTANGGNFYSTPSEVGDTPLTTIVLSPNYVQDKTILAGNTAGQVYLSEDNGISFQLLGQQLPLTGGIGNISLAFDNKFSTNKTIYAATDAKVTSGSKERIFRFTLNKSSVWQSICTGLPDNAVIKQMTVTGNGTLYAINGQAIIAADKKGGMVRSLNPTSSSPTFETVIRGLDDTDVMFEVAIFENQLWSVDTRNNRLMTFTDSLSVPVIPISPEEKASGLTLSNLNLEWQSLRGATLYEWQVSDNPGFTGIAGGFTGTTELCSARVTGLDPATGYYWRVRVNKPFLSPWSDPESFTTVLGGNNVAPLLTLPAAGATTSLKPVFQWGTIASASKYDLLVATDAAFRDIVIEKTSDNALPSNAWESDISLNKSANYYWKVRACSTNSFSDWSAVSVFTTDDPVPAPVLSETTTRAASPVQQSPPVSVAPVQTQTLTNQSTVNVNVNIPPVLIYGGIALLAVVVIALVILAITAVRRRH